MPASSGPGSSQRLRNCHLACVRWWCSANIYDLNHAEIAEELGISESAAKVRLHRARRKLRSQVFPLPGDRPDDPEEEQTDAV